MYIVARSAKQRPTLQHEVSSSSLKNPMTLCGISPRALSWSYSVQTGPLSAILCIKCKQKGGH